MAAAIGTSDFGTNHANAVVFSQSNGLVIGSIVETRPAGATFEFCIAFEDHVPTNATQEITGALFIQQLAAKGLLCALLTQYVILLWAKLFVQLIFVKINHISIVRLFLFGNRLIKFIEIKKFDQRVNDTKNEYKINQGVDKGTPGKGLLTTMPMNGCGDSAQFLTIK
jgi:hypothetical protein